jgi:hypothetical protein
MKVPYSGTRNQSHFNFTINKPQLKTCVHYREDESPIPSWLFVSKTIFSEATSTFNECAEWTWLPVESSKKHVRSPTFFGLSTSKIVAIHLGDLGCMICKLFVHEIGKHFRAKQSHKLTKDYSRIAEDMLACRQTQHLHLWIDLTKHQDTFSLVKFPNVDVDMFEPSQNVPIGALVIQVEETDKVLECMTDEQDAVGTSS